MKYLLYGVLALLTIFGLAVGSMWQADLPFEVAAAKYKSENSQIMTLPSGQSVHWRDEGVKDSAPLVLLHGSNASLHTWEPWVERLRDTYRIITLDFPAHGLSGVAIDDDYSKQAQVRFVDEVMRALKLEEFVLGGNSMGGNVAWNYARAYPQKVRGLILVDASGYPNKDFNGPTIFKLLRYAPFRWLFQKIHSRAMVADGVRNAYNNSPVITDKLINRYEDLNLIEGYRRGNALRFAGRGARDISPPPRGLISVPTLILWGRKDSLIPVSHGQKFNRDFPNSTLVIYDKVGHIPQEEIPGRSARDVRAFLEGMRWRSLYDTK